VHLILHITPYSSENQRSPANMMFEDKEKPRVANVEVDDGSLPRGEVIVDSQWDYTSICRWATILYMVLGAITAFALVATHGLPKIVDMIVQAFPKDDIKSQVYCGLIITVSIVFSIPLSAVVMAAVNGALFGIGKAFLISWISMVLGAMISFGLGRWLFKDKIRQWLLDGQYTRVRRMLHVIEDDRNTFKFLLLFGFTALPVGIKNYFPGAMEISASLFFVTALIRCGWFAYVFVMVGDTLRRALRKYQHPDEGNWFKGGEVLQAGLGIVVMTTLFIYAYREYNKKLNEEEQQAIAESLSIEGGSAASHGATQ